MKILSDRGCCPRCGKRAVTFKKALLLAAWSRWSCDGCGAALGVSLSRRFLVGGLGGAFTGITLLSLRDQNWLMAAICLVAVVYIWTFDKVEVVEPVSDG